MVSPLSPLITGPLLYLLTRTPSSLIPHLNSILTHLPSTLTRSLLVSLLNLVFSLGLVYRASSALTERSLNNGEWRGDPARWEWENEVAVVTGGCSGIGEEVVKGLAGRGVKVVVLDVAELPDRLKDVVALYIKTDITSLPSVRSASTKILQEFNDRHPSILVNNAGIGGGFGMLDCEVERVRKVLDVNLISHWITCSVFVPPMVKANKGHIVELASMSSFISVGSFSDYSAGKAALVSFTESLRDQLRWYYNAPKVHVTIVHPLWVSTPLVAHAKAEIEASSGPMLTPQEVGKTITDQVWKCRGGRLIVPGKMGWFYTTRAWPLWMLDLIKGGGKGERSFLEKAAVKEGGR